MKYDRTVLLLSAFAATMAIVFSATMLLSDGIANMNAYGEGWIEAIGADDYAVLKARCLFFI